MSSIDSSHAWTLTDGNAGNVRQASALARELAPGAAADRVLHARAPWRWAAPRQWPGARGAFGDAFAAALSQPPALVIGCGRQAALATRLLRAQGSVAIQILDPRIDPAHWDVVIAPEHDGLRGPNVVTLAGSLHPVDDAWLDEARLQFAGFAALELPRTAVLLGGTSAHARFEVADFDRLADSLDRVLARDGGSLMVSTSRRTPPAVVAALRRRAATWPGFAWTGDEDGPNPYAGMLAWADRIVCTPDSVNMLSEACASRATVHVFDPVRVEGRPRRFIDALLQRGRIRAMDDALSAFDVEPLRETARVAALVRQRLGL